MSQTSAGELERLACYASPEFWIALRGSGRETEEVLADYFVLLGFDVSLTRASADGGYDLLLRSDDLVRVVDSKAYSGRVGVDALARIFHAAQRHGEADAVLIGLSGFTAQCEREAMHPAARVSLVGLQELTQTARRRFVEVAPDHEHLLDAVRSSRPWESTAASIKAAESDAAQARIRTAAREEALDFARNWRKSWFESRRPPGGEPSPRARFSLDNPEREVYRQALEDAVLEWDRSLESIVEQCAEAYRNQNGYLPDAAREVFAPSVFARPGEAWWYPNRTKRPSRRRRRSRSS